ncbi:DUF1659 domain-containing protein [Heliorestis convoluta]|uniref:DUF1659 domain-containing protein n=1 Tax=Heliorestis convoluta TaxID=356322 RepID=A0A5Q2N4M8_9FIRM|nr:DUF1659 domain-containing protein [Heliorestis convoluta]QGG47210.1 hypothetical protein FTV88_1058 [Heliorestis convoluta]
MSVNTTTAMSTLRIVVLGQTLDDGTQKIQNRDFRGLKPVASNEDVYEVAHLLASLMDHPLEEVQRLDVNNLVSA